MAEWDLLTVDEAKRALNITSAIFDTEVTSYITAVSEQLDALCGPIVKRTVSDETHDGGAGVIWPVHSPVAAVSALAEYRDGVATVLTAETLAAAGDYLLENAGTHNSLIRRRSGRGDSTFTAGRGNVLITYVAGRFDSAAAVAAKYKQAAAICLTNLWRREQGAGSVAFGSVEETAAGRLIPTFGLPHAARDLLAYEMRPPAVA